MCPRGTHLEILNQVIKHPEAFRIVRVLHIDEGTNLGGLERDVIIPETDLQLLLAHDTSRWPRLVVLPT